MKHVSSYILAICLVTALIGLLSPQSVAQVKGEEAEMARLRTKAEDAIASDDPEGAAMMMGRAALMAAQLAKRQDAVSANVYKGLELLFRSQEHTYRALALFRRAGGQLPASSGVCGSLALAQGSLRQAVESVGSPVSELPSRLIEETNRLRESADNWAIVIESMIAEYHCP